MVSRGIDIPPADATGRPPSPIADAACLQTAARLRDWLAAGAAMALPDGCLHAQAGFAMLGREASGAAAVEAALRDNSATPAYARLDWQAPTVQQDAIRLQGERRAGQTERGVVLTLRFDGAQIIQVSQQRLAPLPAPAGALRLPESLKARIRTALADGNPMLMSYVDAQGRPQLSFRGSVQVLGDDALGLWVRDARGGFITALSHHSGVAFMYRDPHAKATYQLHGTAHVVEQATVRERLHAGAPKVERDHDFARLGVAVVVELDRVEGYAGLGPGGQIDRIRLVRGG